MISARVCFHWSYICSSLVVIYRESPRVPLLAVVEPMLSVSLCSRYPYSRGIFRKTHCRTVLMQISDFPLPAMETTDDMICFQVIHINSRVCESRDKSSSRYENYSIFRKLPIVKQLKITNPWAIYSEIVCEGMHKTVHGLHCNCLLSNNEKVDVYLSITVN